jgi:hypothetical protein
MRFEYWVEKVNDKRFPWALKIKLVGDDDMWIGYQLTNIVRKRLSNDLMAFDYTIYRLTMNLKQIIEKENAA